MWRRLLIVKDGRLVVEEYFGDAGREDLHDVRSVTKSVVSALTGIVLARGGIAGVEDPIGGYLDSLVSDLEPEKAAITIEHLLTMTSGVEWDESGGFGDYTKWIQSGDHLGYLLDRPFVAEPGARFNYNSAAVHLLGVVLEQATGMELPELAHEVLFGRIGVARSRWEPLAGGFHNGGAGLDLRPRDLARFGQLYLQGGSSAERRIVPAEWVDRSTVERFDWRFSSGALGGITYGFIRWVVPEAREPFYFAWGFGGQYVVVVPEMYLVMVTTNDWRGVGADAGRYERMTMDVLVEYMIPAFRWPGGCPGWRGAPQPGGGGPEPGKRMMRGGWDSASRKRISPALDTVVVIELSRGWRLRGSRSSNSASSATRTTPVTSFRIAKGETQPRRIPR